MLSTMNSQRCWCYSECAYQCMWIYMSCMQLDFATIRKDFYRNAPNSVCMKFCIAVSQCKIFKWNHPWNMPTYRLGDLLWCSLSETQPLVVISAVLKSLYRLYLLLCVAKSSLDADSSTAILIGCHQTIEQFLSTNIKKEWGTIVCVSTVSCSKSTKTCLISAQRTSYPSSGEDEPSVLMIATMPSCERCAYTLWAYVMALHARVLLPANDRWRYYTHTRINSKMRQTRRTIAALSPTVI